MKDPQPRPTNAQPPLDADSPRVTDPETTAAGWLTAHVSTKLHRGHLVTGRTSLILPCLGRTEEDETAHGPQSDGSHTPTSKSLVITVRKRL